MNTQTHILRTLGLLLFLSLLPGCVVTRTTEVSYAPQTIEELKRVGPCSIHVEVLDGRPAGEQTWVGSFNKVRFVTRPETLQLVRESVISGLQHNGLQVVPDPTAAEVLLRIRLTRFWHELKDHGATLEKLMWVNAEAEVRRTGKEGDPLRIPVNGLYSRTFPILALGTVQGGFEAALADAINQLLIDQRFIKALAVR
ncbi:MAG: hypothetical protein IT581_08825 [Verrucomicrobiales bacterium]|nr:hypothetical protein [Verrucomicrobiales bacterium]